MQSSIALPKDSKKEQKPLVFAAIIDMDGCAISKDMKYDETGKILLGLDKVAPLLQHIIKTALALKPDHYLSMSGSNRQDYLTDKANKDERPPHLNSFPVLESIHNHLKQTLAEHVKLKSSELCRYLTADSYSGSYDGTSAFVMAQQELARLGDKASIEAMKESKAAIPDHYKAQPQAVFDRTKISSIYAWVHTIASNPSYADHEIVIHFYDDTNDILKELFGFFTKFHDLLPSNVVLNLTEYASSEATKISEPSVLRGTGMIDKNIDLNLQSMIMCAQAEVWESEDEISSSKKIKPMTEKYMSEILHRTNEAKLIMDVNTFNYNQFITARERKKHLISTPTDKAREKLNDQFGILLHALNNIIDEFSMIIKRAIKGDEMMRQLCEAEGAHYECSPEKMARKAFAQKIFDQYSMLKNVLSQKIPVVHLPLCNQFINIALDMLVPIMECNDTYDPTEYSQLLRQLNKHEELKEIYKAAYAFAECYLPSAVIKIGNPSSIGLFASTQVELPKLEKEAEKTLLMKTIER